MKKLVVILFSLGLLVGFSSGSFAKELKIGYVDVFKVFDDYTKTKTYDKSLEERKAVEEKKLDAKKKEIEAIQNKISMLKDKEQEKEKEKITQAVKDYRELEQQIFTTLKKERDDKMKELVEDIDKVVKDYAAKNGFDLVINENTILFGDKSMDLTAEILKIVNDKYSASAVKK